MSNELEQVIENGLNTRPDLVRIQGVAQTLGRPLVGAIELIASLPTSSAEVLLVELNQ